tara:strand:- start:42 stop:1103 length:1062 start_codon:yes stop_codon:yes gene_type:complete
MILKKIFSFAASIIKFFILNLFIITNSYSEVNSLKKYKNDNGVLAIMYHRFEENKYPSTNIRINDFKDQINYIIDKGYEFYNPSKFISEFNEVKTKKKILLTIDDAYQSFYDKAWPFLKQKNIPFILFVSTEPVGKNGYMDWKTINEIEKENFVFIGNHSHSHEYLVEYDYIDFINDIDKSIEIFKNKLGYNPKFFSYPFGEYSLEQKKYIAEKFDTAFGQNSGVIDLNKDKFELPRFPINEKYGEFDRFKFIVDLKPLEYKEISIKDNLIKKDDNPPDLYIKFFKEQKNLDKINCFSDEGDNWQKTKINLEANKLVVSFKDKFKFRRGRINCSMRDADGWRWLGLQFSIKKD